MSHHENTLTHGTETGTTPHRGGVVVNYQRGDETLRDAVDRAHRTWPASRFSVMTLPLGSMV